MRAPLAVLILIVAGALGFLLVYSQTGIPEKPAGEAPAGGYGAAPAAGGYGSAPAAGGYGAPAGGYGAPGGGYGAPPKPAAGGYGK
ncbi:MAG: hypothetical protein M1508_06660 [Nitrospirae bacterium]|nr:hypothetical protein [Nitrospirota bacterium]